MKLGRDVTIPRTDWQEPFLAALPEVGSIRAACRRAKIHHSTFYAYCAEHPDFSAKVDAAKGKFGDHVEDVFIRGALVGWLEPVYNGKVKVGTIRRFDLLGRHKLLVRHKPEYRSQQDVSLTVDAATAFARLLSGDPPNDGDR